MIRDRSGVARAFRDAKNEDRHSRVITPIHVSKAISASERPLKIPSLVDRFIYRID